MTAKALRWGLLSTAAIGEVVVRANRGSAVTDFAAVASRDATKAAAYAAAHGIGTSFGSYEAMLISDEIDAVYVALPVSLHTEWTVKALRAGKHVLCEKPFATSGDDAAACAEAAHGSGRRCVEGFMWRLHPQTVLVQKLLADGAIGELGTVRAALSVTAPAGDIRRTKSLGGGALFDLGCYCTSAIRLFGGAVDRVCAVARWEPDGLDRRFAASLACSSGVLGSFDVGLDLAARRDELELIGTEGVITVTDPWICRSRTVRLRTADGVRDIEIPGATGADEDAVYRLEFDVISAAFAHDTNLPYDLSDAVEQAATLGALDESARTGRAVHPHLPAVSASRGMTEVQDEKDLSR
jgi:D-xylose 1-dehydrogenase (NADP+, D-xylono-1,5-lactone-forming)